MALGRGLSELLGEVETAYENSGSTKKESNELDVELIDANPYQPRKVFDEEKLKELSDSIKTHGLLQPIIVIKKSETRYTLIAGERRLRAHKLANLKTIKAIILETEELKLRELALIENIQRDDLNIIELAYSYAQLINDHELTHEELAKRVSKSRSSITNTLRLLSLPVFTQQAVSTEKISAGHAKVLIGITEEQQKEIVQRVIDETLSVRETEKLVKELKQGDKKESDELTKTKRENTYNFNSLNNILKNLEEKNLKVKLDDKYFKIEIKSQEDIEKISQLFS